MCVIYKLRDRPTFSSLFVIVQEKKIHFLQFIYVENNLRFVCVFFFTFLCCFVMFWVCFFSFLFFFFMFTSLLSLSFFISIFLFLPVVPTEIEFIPQNRVLFQRLIEFLSRCPQQLNKKKERKRRLNVDLPTNRLQTFYRQCHFRKRLIL